jgi:hypothetical protein
MTRKDWWLGISLVLVALVIQTLILVYVTRHSSESAQTPRSVPTFAKMTTR